MSHTITGIQNKETYRGLDSSNSCSVSSPKPSNPVVMDKHLLQTLKQLREEVPTDHPLTPTPGSAQTLSKKLSFHMLSDFWGQGRSDANGQSLEGMGKTEVLVYLATSLEHLGKTTNNAAYAELSKKYKRAAEISSAIYACSNTEELNAYVKNAFTDSLNSQTSSFIPIGWTGLPRTIDHEKHTGHAMMAQLEHYELDGKQLCRIRLLNTGGGLTNYHLSCRSNFKQKFAPYLEWDNIDPSEAKDPMFWKGIFECVTVPKWFESVRPQYDDHNVYWQFQQRFGVPKNQVDVNGFITAQRAGTCPKKSADGIARMSESPDAYKRYKLLTKLQAAEDLFSNWSTPGNPLYRDLDAFEILQKGLEKLEGSVFKALNQKQLDQDPTQKEIILSALHSLVFRFEREKIQHDLTLLEAPSEEYQALQKVSLSTKVDGSRSMQISNLKYAYNLSYGSNQKGRKEIEIGSRMPHETIVLPRNSDEVGDFLISLKKFLKLAAGPFRAIDNRNL
jgi:hypothetical protein